jgi:hypothetical protein
MKIPLNLRPFMDRVLEAFDVENKDEFYAAQGPAGIPGMQPGDQGRRERPRRGRRPRR